MLKADETVNFTDSIMVTIQLRISAVHFNTISRIFIEFQYYLEFFVVHTGSMHDHLIYSNLHARVHSASCEMNKSQMTYDQGNVGFLDLVHVFPRYAT